MLKKFHITLQGDFWRCREKAVPLHYHSKKGCTRQSSSELDFALVCTFFAAVNQSSITLLTTKKTLKRMKKETWKQILQIVITILTARGTSLGVSSCM